MAQGGDFAGLLKRAFQLSMHRDHIVAVVLGSAIWALGSVLSLGLLIGPLSLAMAIIGLKVVRGEPARLEDLRQGLDRFVPTLVASILMVAVILAGFLALVIPGIIAVVALTFTWHVMAEQPELSGTESMTESFRLVRTALPDVVFLWVVALVLSLFVGPLVPFVGNVLVIGYIVVLTSLVYEDVSRREAN
jgi:uncharacterized membrane protein